MATSRLSGLRWSPLVLIITVLSLPPFAASTLDTRRLLRDVEEAVGCRGNPALALIVCQNTDVLFGTGFGRNDLDSGNRVTPDTRFGIASLSKSFAATLLVKLLHKNGMNTSAKVTDIMGSDFQLGDEISTKEANVEDILSHRMGLPSHNQIRFSGMDRAELTGQLRYLRPTEPLRTKFMYSNLMYGLATRMAEVLGKARWEDLVRKELLEPLGMSSTTFLTEVEMRGDNFATPYSPDFSELIRVPDNFSTHWAELCGSGCVVSTANDMARWAHFHLSRGLSPTGNRVMEENLVRDLQTPHMTLTSTTTKYFTKPDVPHTLTFTTYGMGWRLGFYRGYPIVGHTGSTYGYRAFLAMVPSHNISVFVAMTGDDDNYNFRYAIIAHALDLALGEAPWLTGSTLCSFPEPWVRLSSSSEPKRSKEAGRTLESYVGSYSNQAYGTLQVSKDMEANSSEPRLTLRYGIGQWHLVPQGGDEFYGAGEGLAVVRNISSFRFRASSAGGTVDELVARGFESADPPVFTKVRPGGDGTNGAASFEIPCFFGILLIGALFSYNTLSV